MENKKCANCMIPGCKKDVFDEGYKFCGEHERKYKDAKSKTLRGVGGIAVAGVVLVSKTVLSSLKKK